jgi:hypothetical protein
MVPWHFEQYQFNLQVDLYVLQLSLGMIHIYMYPKYSSNAFP